MLTESKSRMQWILHYNVLALVNRFKTSSVRFGPLMFISMPDRPSYQHESIKILFTTGRSKIHIHTLFTSVSDDC